METWEEIRGNATGALILLRKPPESILYKVAHLIRPITVGSSVTVDFFLLV
jgi:hypothetical protein